MKSELVEKAGSMGALVAAVACPACFPLLAAISAALGLGIFQPFEGWVFVLFQVLVLIALIGNFLSFLRHRRVLPLILGGTGAALILFSLHIRFNQPLLYFGLLGLAAASFSNFLANRRWIQC